MNLWWKCPNCEEKVDYLKQMKQVFDYESGEAEFCAESGLWVHTISCDKCNAQWHTSISKMNVT